MGQGRNAKRQGSQSHELLVLKAINQTTGAVLTTGGTQTRTHNTVNTSGSGTVPAGSLAGSVLNLGNEDATWNGVTLPAGVSLPWGNVANRDTYGAIAYDATTPGAGTTLIIEYTT